MKPSMVRVSCRQVTVTPTACWESWWGRALGRPRRRKRGSLASGRGERSWRNVPAPKRCYLPGVSMWPKSNRRLWTRCGMRILCCEYEAVFWHFQKGTAQDDTRHVQEFSVFTPKLLVMWPVLHVGIPVKVELICFLSTLVMNVINSQSFSCFLFCSLVK